MSTGSRRRRIGAAILGLLVGVGLQGEALAVSKPGRVTGRVKDANGQPLSGLILRFTPVDPALGEARTVETNKKARFSDLTFPAGAWKLDPRVGEYFLESLTYSLLDREGLKRASWGAKSHPRDGFPPFEVPSGGTIRLDLVAADSVAGEELSRGAAWARHAKVLDEIGQLFNAGKAAEALEAAEALLQQDPDLGPALYLKGAALNRLGRRQEAIENLRRAREMLPEQPGISGMLGEALLARALDLSGEGDAAGARPLADEAADLLASDMGEAFGQHWNHALALKTAGRDAELRETLVKLTESHPEQPDSFQELAELQFRSGQPDEALATLERMPPAGAANGAILLFNQALDLFDAEKPDAALDLLQKSKAMDPTFAMAHNLEAQILLSKGDREAAAAALRRFIELAPEGADTSGAKRTLEALEPAAANQ